MTAVYNKNPHLKAAGVPIQFTKEQIEEYVKCARDPLHFIENYAKIVSLDKGVIPFAVYPYQRRIIEAIHNNKDTLAKLFRQAGKALPLNTPIATEHGLRPIGEIDVGDKVYGPDGKLCNVTAVNNPHLVNMFKITFDNGDEVVCCEDHQWTVIDRHNKRVKIGKSYKPAQLVLSTKQLYESKWKRVNNRGYSEYAYYIPNTDPVQYCSKQQLIDPYLLGVWLGDDSITEMVVGLSLDQLRHYNLINNKHIPADYMLGDVSQRINLLQGIMDTDGFVAKGSGTCHIQLGNHNPRLLDDVYTLLCSLGLKVTKMVCLKTNSTRYSFSCPRSKFDVFRIPHKLAQQPQTCARFSYTNSRTIQNIEPLNQQLGKCIQVDNSSSSYLCTNSYIPTHNSTIVAAYFAWYILFNDNKTAAILGNKQAVAVEIFSRVQFIIENLPPWLQQGVVEWNKKSLVLENGSRCIAAATSASAVRGFSINLLLLDEFAHLKPKLAEEFIASVFPTLSSSESSKLVIISTPNGLNHFYKLWVESENGRNSFKTVKGHWSEARSKEWAEDQRRKLNNDVKYMQEIECEFTGSSYTLVDGTKLAQLALAVPIYQRDGLEIFEKPMKDHNYVITVDVSRGRHMDYSAFTIFDVSSTPYKVVGTFKDNQISTTEYPHLIFNSAREYNNAFLLVEINDLGEEVANTLWHEYEYENLYFTRGNEITSVRGYPGVRTTTKVKSIGCSVLKELIEKHQLDVRSHKIVEELSQFVLSKKSYAAQDPSINDDLCTTMWLFAWLSIQPIFQEVTNNNLRQLLAQKKQQYIDDAMTPFGFFDDHRDEAAQQHSVLPTKSSPIELTNEQIALLKM